MMQILLIEDNPGDILLVRRALAEHAIAHELHVVRDGGLALDFIRRIGQPDGPPCPDVVLLDLNLPKVQGHEILAELRKHPGCARTPVIVVSSSDAEREKALMSGLGVSRYFRKPSDLGAFLQLGAVVREVTADRAR